jgi:transcriptional regulator with XRE-family HTH domain
MNTRLSENLRSLMNLYALSENALSRHTGVPQQVINRILRKENQNPTLATLLPLCQHFKVTASDMLGDYANLPGKKAFGASPTALPLIIEADVLDFLIPNYRISDHTSVITHTPVSTKAFATRLSDPAVAARFLKDSFLIFDPASSVNHNDLFLFKDRATHALSVRKCIIKEGVPYHQSIDPAQETAEPLALHPEENIVAPLVQVIIQCQKPMPQESAAADAKAATAETV